MTTASNAKRLGAKPVARLVAHASAAQEPEWFTTAPVGAVRSLLARAQVSAVVVDLWEVNEAFAVVAMAFTQELGLDPDRVNLNGGAVALGHPIGCSGTRITVTLLSALQERGLKTGMATLCLGGGEAVAMSVEMLD